MNKILIYLSVIFFSSCKSEINTPEEYIEKFKHYDYSMFKNSSVYLRSGDILTGELTIFVREPYEEDRCARPIIIYYNFRNKKINDIKNRADDTCHINNEIACELALEFVKHKAQSIRVDSSGNVYVNFSTFHVIRISSTSNLQTIANEFSGVNPDEYSLLSDSWYVKYKENE